MMRKLLLLSAILVSFSMAVKAQFCGSDIATRQLLLEHPELADRIMNNQKLMEEQINAIYKSKQVAALAKTTGATLHNDSFMIPVVVHVIHDYNSAGAGIVDDVTDAQIANMMNNLNIYYNARNTDLSGVIQPFKKYIGNMHIAFRLATKDPTGAPTKGVTHRQSYLTYGGDNYAKYDLWDPSSYLNIWVERFIGLSAQIPGSIVAAYSQLPDVGAADPFIDGLITNAQFIDNGAEAFVISHEVGHYLGLLHPFGSNNTGCASSGCGDDGVDDTPPTTGEFCVTCALGLYDTMCATGYVKHYPGVIHADSIVDYPDTANTQNIMTYSECDPELMFTKGQAWRVQAVLQATLANRVHLSSDTNLITTGVLDPIPALPPVADYSINNHFVCAGTTGTSVVTFTNQSWNDTIASIQWSLPSYAQVPSSTSITKFSSYFTQPGWVPISITATGVHNHGSNTRVDSNNLYVADINTTNPVGYYQEFNPSLNADVGKYPMFNYYNNEFKWKLNSNTGYYDNSCVQYTGFDNRSFPANAVGLPKGDYDDMYTPAFDLTQLNGGPATPSLNFMYSATSLTSTVADINDTLEIDYNVSCGNVWTPLAYLTKASLINQGASSIAYRPLWYGAWSLQSIPLINGAKNAISSSTIFRFRYKPGVNFGYYAHTSGGYSTGNNFYMDRLNFSNFPAGLNTLMPNDKTIMVAPNPTNGDAFVLVSTKDDVNANIQVTDIAGRVVYTATQATTGNLTRIAIPRSAITATGMYLVHVTAGDLSKTEKLVVY